MRFQDDCISRTGTIQGCMIFADFSDAQSPASESVEELRDLLIPDAAKWYQTASYGQLELNITADTTKFYRMPKSAASYKGKRVFSAEQHLSYIQDALDAYTNNGARPPPAETDILYIATTRNNDKMTRTLGSSFSVSTRSLHGMGNLSPEELSPSAPIPTSLEGGVKASVVAKNDTSALVVEARVAKGVDGNICAPGVLLYTVDTTLAMSEGSIKVLDVTPGSNGYGDANGAVERRDFVDEWEEVV
ncbi:hypothetical protein FVER14953_08519 [Fusarium verticillioides]|nr:hypothetical protein FVER14953_08519 [Fusarium verticillioides]